MASTLIFSSVRFRPNLEDPRTVDGMRLLPKEARVLFVAFHPSYTRSQREYDVAIIGMIV